MLHDPFSAELHPTESAEMILEATLDETCILPSTGDGRRGSKGRKPRSSTKKEAKKVDIPTHRLRTATKTITQLKFIQASFRDIDGKIQGFYGDHNEMREKAQALKSSGVNEDRIMTDASLNLQDSTALVRLMYTVIDRHRLLQILSLGSDCMKLDGLPDVLRDDVDHATLNAINMLKGDPFLAENAQDIKSYFEFRNVEVLFESLTDKEEIDNLHEDIKNVIKSVKTCVTAIRRTMSDYVQMVKSTTKAREKFEEQIAKANNQKATHGGLHGRPNLQNILDTDPEVLKHFK